MPPKSAITDQEFLYIAIKLSPQVTANFDFQKIGDALGITKHSAYCRWNTLKKKFEAEQATGDKTDKPATETPKRKRAGAGSKKKGTQESEDEGTPTPSKKSKSESKKNGEVKQETIAEYADLLDNCDLEDI